MLWKKEEENNSWPKKISMSADHLLDILLQAPGQGHVHDPPDPLGIPPHAKCHCSHHTLDLASTKGQLDLLSVLQVLHIDPDHITTA